jgi:cystathionine beta-lyase
MVTDEVHCDIIRKDVEFKPMMSVVGTKGIIALTAINKTFNLAGLSMSSIIVCDDELKKAFENYFALPSPFGVAAGIAAYNEGGAWVDELNEYLDRNLDFADAFIKEHLPKAKRSFPLKTRVALYSDCLSQLTVVPIEE